jgi:ribosome-binding ATPase YchF (GTP1/OBG family)
VDCHPHLTRKARKPLKIGFAGIELPEGKIKHKNDRMNVLVEKDQPQKVSPFYVELVKDEFVQTEAIIVDEASILDILIEDIEKCEGRIDRSDDENEKRLMEKCLEYLEQEIPLCDGEFSDDEREHLRQLGFLSLKPVVTVEEPTDENALVQEALNKAGIIFFYTSGPKEVHAWPVPRGSDMFTCAGKIHSDLARGFIKGDVVSYNDYLQCHNFNDGRKKGFVKVVDKDHVVEDGDVIEIRFNV